MIDKIILVGMRGCGKSHFGSCLSDEFGWPKIDTDDEIESSAKRTIGKIVKDEGWESFRNWEYGICKKVSKLKKVIISTGGGLITFERNRKELLKNSLVIFLFTSLPELLSRLDKDTTRPSLTGKSDLQEEMEQIWNERKEIYFSVSDIVFRAKKDLSHEKRKNVELNSQILAKKIREVLRDSSSGQ